VRKAGPMLVIACFILFTTNIATSETTTLPPSEVPTTLEPTIAPSQIPSTNPSLQPTSLPTFLPSQSPTTDPTTATHGMGYCHKFCPLTNAQCSNLEYSGNVDKISYCGSEEAKCFTIVASGRIFGDSTTLKGCMSSSSSCEAIEQKAAEMDISVDCQSFSSTLEPPSPELPTNEPESQEPTNTPTNTPTIAPSSEPSTAPTNPPTSGPSYSPTDLPLLLPTAYALDCATCAIDVVSAGICASMDSATILPSSCGTAEAGVNHPCLIQIQAGCAASDPGALELRNIRRIEEIAGIDADITSQDFAVFHYDDN